MSFFPCEYDEFDGSMYQFEYNEKYEGLSMDEIADLEEDEENRQAYESMMLDSYNW